MSQATEQMWIEANEAGESRMDVLEAQMTEDEFRNALVDLIDRARSAETISLENLTGIIDAET